MRKVNTMRIPLLAVALMVNACSATTPSPSPTATQLVAPSPSQSLAAPTPTATPGDRFGYVQVASERITVRRERDAAPVFELAGKSPAVSVDGKRLAYWRTNANGEATDLRVLDVSNPSSDRSVLALPSATLGGSVVWSNDGQGLLVGTYSRARTVSPGPESCPLETEIVMLDLTTTPPATRSAGSGGCGFHLLAWDRPGQIAAAISTGPGGYATEYLIWNGNAASAFARVPVPNEPGEARARTLLISSWVHASADAKFVMGVEASRTVVRVWPILDITTAEYVRHPSLILPSPVWRPGVAAPYELIWAIGQKVDLFQHPGGATTTLFTSTDNVGLAAVRPDGSGVLVFSQSGGAPPPNPQRLVVVDIATRQATEVTVNTSFSYQFVSRGVLLR